MINIKNQVPDIYYDASRDFQVLGHLYEVVLNYAKTNADMLYLLPNRLEPNARLTELLALTLGFKLRRNYDKAQLAALASIFPRLLKLKGTKQAIDLAGNALVKASGVPGAFSSEIENHILTVKIPIELSDITLFLDLLPYILPFGIRVSVIRNTVEKRTISVPIGAMATMRGAFPSTENAHEKFLPHPLGLAKVSESKNGLTVDYSNSNFVSPETSYEAEHYSERYSAMPGQFGTSPIITFDPNDSLLATNTEIKEETT
jgi:hypothetical protein